MFGVRISGLRSRIAFAYEAVDPPHRSDGPQLAVGGVDPLPVLCHVGAMRMREHTLFVRLATHRDLLDPGIHLDLVRSAEDLTESEFETFRDLVPARMPTHPLAGRRAEFLDCHVGAGMHQSARFELTGPPEAPLRRLELHAALHPYSGAYTTFVDLRLDVAWALANIAAVDDVVRHWIEATEPFSVHAHDTDDDAIQNCGNVGMLRRGFGVEVESVDLAANPGREVNRGQFRYCVNWLTHLGPELLAKLDFDASDLPVPVEEIGGGMLLKLGPDPGSPELPERREVQATVREVLGFREVGDRDRRLWGYWQRKA